MTYYYKKVETGKHAGKYIKITVNNGAIIDAEILTAEQFKDDIKNKDELYHR